MRNFNLSPVRRVVFSILAMTIAGLAACGGGDGGGGGGAAPQVIGLDSNIAPNNGVRCIDGPPAQDGVSQFPNLLFPFQGIAGSCTLLTFSAQAPAQPGTVTTASIRVGATTGRMRFVRLRNLYQNERGSNGIRVCCSIQEYGAIFTPTPNSVTTVALNFRMTFEPPPPAIDFTTVIGQDHVGLEVLDTNTPIPGVWTRNGLPHRGVIAPARHAGDVTQAPAD